MGAWRGGVGVSCAGRGPGLAGALSARGVSHHRRLRNAPIVLVRVGLTQTCAGTTRVIYGPAWRTTNHGSTTAPLTAPPPPAAETSAANCSSPDNMNASPQTSAPLCLGADVSRVGVSFTENMIYYSSLLHLLHGNGHRATDSVGSHGPGGDACQLFPVRWSYSCSRSVHVDSPPLKRPAPTAERIQCIPASHTINTLYCQKWCSTTPENLHASVG